MEQLAEEAIDRILKANDPVEFLKQVCEKIDYTLSPSQIEKMKNEGCLTELIYYYLRSLYSVLKRYLFFEVNQKELFERLFLTLVESIINWDPQTVSAGYPYCLTNYLANNMVRSAQDFISNVYGLGNQGQFGFVDLYWRLWLNFEASNGREPTLGEITKLVLEEKTQEIPPSATVLEERLFVGRARRKVLLIYAKTHGQFIEKDEETVDHEREVCCFCLVDDIYQIMRSLRPYERAVLIMRSYGDIEGSSEGALTLEETGKILGMSREKVRQIEARAFRKMRHPTRARRLRDYLTM